MAEYCAADPRRLKGMVLAPANDPAWSARTIKDLVHEDWVAAVCPLLPEGLPIDDPDLEPIWAAANDADLPICSIDFSEGVVLPPGLHPMGVTEGCPWRLGPHPAAWYREGRCARRVRS